MIIIFCCWVALLLFFFPLRVRFFTERIGGVTSPDYPTPYPTLSSCSYSIQVEDSFLIMLEFMETFNVETYPGVLCPCDILKVMWGLLYFITVFVRQAPFFYCFFSMCFSMLIYSFVSLYLSSFISSSHPFSFLFFFSFFQHLPLLGDSPKPSTHMCDDLIDFMTTSTLITDRRCQESQLNLLHSVCLSIKWTQ